MAEVSEWKAFYSGPQQIYKKGLHKVTVEPGAMYHDSGPLSQGHYVYLEKSGIPVDQTFMGRSASLKDMLTWAEGLTRRTQNPVEGSPGDARNLHNKLNKSFKIYSKNPTMKNLNFPSRLSKNPKSRPKLTEIPEGMDIKRLPPGTAYKTADMSPYTTTGGHGHMQTDYAMMPVGVAASYGERMSAGMGSGDELHSSLGERLFSSPEDVERRERMRQILAKKNPIEVEEDAPGKRMTIKEHEAFVEHLKRTRPGDAGPAIMLHELIKAGQFMAVQGDDGVVRYHPASGAAPNPKGKLRKKGRFMKSYVPSYEEQEQMAVLYGGVSAIKQRLRDEDTTNLHRYISQLKIDMRDGNAGERAPDIIRAGEEILQERGFVQETSHSRAALPSAKMPLGASPVSSLSDRELAEEYYAVQDRLQSGGSIERDGFMTEDGSKYMALTEEIKRRRKLNPRRRKQNPTEMVERIISTLEDADRASFYTPRQVKDANEGIRALVDRYPNDEDLKNAQMAIESVANSMQHQGRRRRQLQDSSDILRAIHHLNQFVNRQNPGDRRKARSLTQRKDLPPHARKCHEMYERYLNTKNNRTLKACLRHCIEGTEHKDPKVRAFSKKMMNKLERKLPK